MLQEKVEAAERKVHEVEEQNALLHNELSKVAEQQTAAGTAQTDGAPCTHADCRERE